MTTQTMTAENLVNAILTSPELKASILKVVQSHLAAATSTSVVPAKVTPAPQEQVTPVTQERPVVTQEATKENYPTNNGQEYGNLHDRDMTVGLLRGTDHFSSFPHAGVFSPNKPRIKKLVMAMAREIAAMYNRGMRTLHVALFPGAELLVADVMQLFKEHNRFTDLTFVMMDTPAFASIRLKRRHEALVFDVTRIKYLSDNTEIVSYDRPSDMTNASRLLRAGHFLMVSDKTINRHLMEFFKRQRALGATCYYVNPSDFLSMVDPEDNGPKGGGAPAPKAEKPAIDLPTGTVINLSGSMFEGGDTSSPSASSTQEETPEKEKLSASEELDRLIEASTTQEEEDEEDEEERIHFEKVAARKEAQAIAEKAAAVAAASNEPVQRSRTARRKAEAEAQQTQVVEETPVVEEPIVTETVASTVAPITPAPSASPAAPIVEVSGLSFSSDMFATGPLDAIITPAPSASPASSLIPSAKETPVVETPVETATEEDAEPVVKDARYFYEKMHEALDYENCDDVVTVNETKQALYPHLKHKEEGHMFQRYTEEVANGADYHDFVLCKMLDYLQDPADLSVKNVLDYFIDFSRFQVADVREQTLVMRSRFMLDPYVMVEEALAHYKVDRVQYATLIHAINGSLEALVEELHYFETFEKKQTAFHGCSVLGTWA